MSYTRYNQTYAHYKHQWIKYHIDHETMLATMDDYKNSPESEAMIFDEFVEEYGFANGECYVSFSEWYNTEHVEI